MRSPIARRPDASVEIEMNPVHEPVEPHRAAADRQVGRARPARHPSASVLAVYDCILPLRSICRRTPAPRLPDFVRGPTMNVR